MVFAGSKDMLEDDDEGIVDCSFIPRMFKDVGPDCVGTQSEIQYTPSWAMLVGLLLS